jgi:hypothetical protein
LEGLLDENTLISGVAGQSLINKTSSRTPLIIVFLTPDIAVLFFKSHPVPSQGKVYLLNFAPRPR